MVACVAGGMASAKARNKVGGGASPSPHSPRGFAARLIVGSAAKTLFRVRLQSRQLCRLIRWEKVSLVAVMLVVLSSRSKHNSRSPLTVPVGCVACKGGLCLNPSSRVARLAGAPFPHVSPATSLIRVRRQKLRRSCNLVPRVSLLCLPWSGGREERPWERG